MNNSFAGFLISRSVTRRVGGLPAPSNSQAGVLRLLVKTQNELRQNLSDYRHGLIALANVDEEYKITEKNGRVRVNNKFSSAAKVAEIRETARETALLGRKAVVEAENKMSLLMTVGSKRGLIFFHVQSSLLETFDDDLLVILREKAERDHAG